MITLQYKLDQDFNNQRIKKVMRLKKCKKNFKIKNKIIV